MCSEEKPLHIVTPLVQSAALAKLVPECEDVYLKMENCQISGSFKFRGYGRLTQKLCRDGCKHIMAVTTGNTGAAVAYVSRLFGVPCTLYMQETLPPLCSQRMRQAGAEVVITGTTFNDAFEATQEAVRKLGYGFVNPNSPEVWKGHSTIVDELITQLPSKPSAIVVSVGDGCLLLALARGLQRSGWEDVPLIGVETKGTECFNLSVKANKMVALDEITSIVKCLGARTVHPELLGILPQFNIFSEVVSDAQAVESCIRFADDEYTIVEPGSGAALAAVYSGILSRLHAEGKLPNLKSGPVVIIVGGGRCVSLQLLQQWAKQFNVPFPQP